MADEQIENLKNQLNLKDRVPDKVYQLLDRRDGAAILVQELPKTFEPISVMDGMDGQTAWSAVGLFYVNQQRHHEALSIFTALYDHMLLAQDQKDQRFHKGTPLVFISDCYGRLGYPLISQRYLMLTLVEDAVREAGTVSPDTTGTYFRLVWGGGLSDGQLNRYAREMYDLYQKNPIDGRYPEWILQELDRNWITRVPAPQEVGVFPSSSKYIRYLLSGLGAGSGKILESLADYVMSCMLGCRTTKRARTGSTDLDLVCSMEGFELDFRSELGRYFACECKDWNSPADFTTMAKFCRVLDSIKSRFGIIFTKRGITGEGRTRDAELEQLKVFQDRGMVIVAVDQQDLEQVADGLNFISLLRAKYERVRLNLIRFSVP